MRFLLPVVASMLTLGFACGGGDEASDEPTDEKADGEADANDDEKADEKEDEKADKEDEKDDAPRGKANRGKGGKSARGASYEDSKVVCCDADRVNRVMQEYLDVHQNLLKEVPSTGDANALWGHLDATADDATLPRSTRDAARRAADITAKFRDSDTAGMREHFSDVGVEIRTMVSTHKGKGDHTIAYVACPLGGGAYWYQTASSVQNPFGSAQNCGHFEP